MKQNDNNLISILELLANPDDQLQYWTIGIEESLPPSALLDILIYDEDIVNCFEERFEIQSADTKKFVNNISDVHSRIDLDTFPNLSSPRETAEMVVNDKDWQLVIHSAQCLLAKLK